MTGDAKTGGITTALTTIREAMVHLGFSVWAESLREGLDQGDIRTLLARVELPAGSDLEELYGWADGSSLADAPDIGSVYLSPGFYLLSLSDAIAENRVMSEDRRWKEGWLPILADGGGDFMVIDLASGDARPVRRFRDDEEEHPVEYLSLQSMLLTFAEAFERGVFYRDQEGYLEMRYEDYARLASRLNPGVDWWI